DKAAALRFLRRRFPAFDLRPTLHTTALHHGLVKAACLAEFGRLSLPCERPDASRPGAGVAIVGRHDPQDVVAHGDSVDHPTREETPMPLRKRPRNAGPAPGARPHPPAPAIPETLHPTVQGRQDEPIDTNDDSTPQRQQSRGEVPGTSPKAADADDPELQGQIARIL